MAGVIVPGVEDDRIVWARLYMEPVEMSCFWYKRRAEVPRPTGRDKRAV